MICSLLFAERQGFFLRCATKALRDNEPRVSHPGFPYKQIGCKSMTCSLFVCGKTGIRTLGTRKGTTVFETVPIDHSGIFPWMISNSKHRL